MADFHVRPVLTAVAVVRRVVLAIDEAATRTEQGQEVQLGIRGQKRVKGLFTRKVIFSPPQTRRDKMASRF
jgi:hypothetical protein